MRQLTDRAGAQFTAMSIKECKAPDGQISSRERPKKPNLSQIPCRGIAHHETSITRSIHGGERKKKEVQRRMSGAASYVPSLLTVLPLATPARTRRRRRRKSGRTGKNRGAAAAAAMDVWGSCGSALGWTVAGRAAGDHMREREREKRRGGRWRRGGGGVGDGSAGEGSGVEWSGRMGTRTPPAQPHAHWLAACRVGGLAGWAPRTGTATTGTWSVAEPERNTVFYSIHRKKINHDFSCNVWLSVLYEFFYN